MNIKVVKQAEITKMIGISKTTLWRMIQKGVFPAPFKLGERINAWRVETIEAWLNEQSAKGGNAC